MSRSLRDWRQAFDTGRGPAKTPNERLAKQQTRARFTITIFTVICAALLFLEFLMAISLPASVGYSTFLDFTKSTSIGVNPAFQYGLSIFCTLVGIGLCIYGFIVTLLGHFRLILAYIPSQITLGVLGVIRFVLWALVTELYSQMAAGMVFCLLSIPCSFGAALAATNYLMMPTFVRDGAHAPVEPIGGKKQSAPPQDSRKEQ